MDFAFFVVNFHYSRADYDALTEREKLFIRKAYETKTVTDTTLIRDAVFNAMWNVNRKKGRSFRQLWRYATKPADKGKAKDDMKLIQEIEEKETDWISRIYEANGMKKPEKR